ncbi:MAG: VCBS repeat-containing protein, partial [Planctomycetaceae bacterium]|nr:VCBS repeat-containing protein [Planctomycetaceae bacterium]
IHQISIRAVEGEMMPYIPKSSVGLTVCLLSFLNAANLRGQDFERISYNNPGLVVDLGVGLWAWPLPMDYDGDGDMDLVVSCPDKPYNGTYFFENPGSQTASNKMPVFKPAVRIGSAIRNVQLSYVDGQPRVLAPNYEYKDFRKSGLEHRTRLPAVGTIHAGAKIRANQWKLADYDGDGTADLIVGIGDWTAYGWDNAFNEKGEWTRGPLNGFVYYLKNTGTDENPRFENPKKVLADGKPVDVYGMPSPNFADFDSDGDLDLICGEFLDGFTYFQNIGTAQSPKYSTGKKLTSDSHPLHMDLQMITPVAVDWDRDGDMDLVCGDEDGRVAFIEHTGTIRDGVPQFLSPKYFQQEAKHVKFGALVTPVSVDWDNDGDEDLICGNTAGYIGFIENLDGKNPPKWAAPKYLEANGKVFRVEAGSNGSIQGPCEAKWGYTTLSVADWNHDGLLDIIYNSIWGRVEWLENIGTREQPKLAASKPIHVKWKNAPPKPEWVWWTPAKDELATQWRTTPIAHDLTKDGLTDLVMLDHEGYLVLFERKRDSGKLSLSPPRRIFYADGPSVYGNRHQIESKSSGLLRLNSGFAGKSGRRKLCLVDWNCDGNVDLLANSQSVHLLKNLGMDREGNITFHDEGPISSQVLAGHTTSPTSVDWDKNGIPDLLVGAEDGFLYYLKNPMQEQAATK